MQIELVSELGARLPRGAGPLEFGATEADARRRLESLVEPARTSFARGTSWSWRARIGDRWVEASAGGDGLLGEIRVARAIEGVEPDVDDVTGVVRIPVVYRGIDLFEHTMAEVEFLLGAGAGVGGGVRDLRLTGVSGHALSVTLVDLTRPHARG